MVPSRQGKGARWAVEAVSRDMSPRASCRCRCVHGGPSGLLSKYLMQLGISARFEAGPSQWIGGLAQAWCLRRLA